MTQKITFAEYIKELLEQNRKIVVQENDTKIRKWPLMYARQWIARHRPDEDKDKQILSIPEFNKLAKQMDISVNQMIPIIADREVRYLAARDFVLLANENGLSVVRAKHADYIWDELYRPSYKGAIPKSELQKVKDATDGLQIILETERTVILADELAEEAIQAARDKRLKDMEDAYQEYYGD